MSFARVFFLIRIFFVCIATVANGAGNQSGSPITLANMRPMVCAISGTHFYSGCSPRWINFMLGRGNRSGPGQNCVRHRNPAGTISGRYADGGGAIHAIIRSADGTISRSTLRERGQARDRHSPPSASTRQVLSLATTTTPAVSSRFLRSSGRCDYYL